MGVMECNRKDCNNIMCDNHSKITGYICNECKQELEESYPACIEDVKMFMESSKNNRNSKEFSLDALFENKD